MSLADNTLVFRSLCPHTSLLHPWPSSDQNPVDECSTLLLVFLYLCTGKSGSESFPAALSIKFLMYLTQARLLPGPSSPPPWPRLASFLTQACFFLGLGAWGAACIPSLMLCEASRLNFLSRLCLGFHVFSSSSSLYAS